MEIRSVPNDVDRAGRTVIAGVLSRLSPLEGSESVLEDTQASLLKAAQFEGKGGQVVTVPYGDGSAVLVGLGDEASFESLRSAAGNAVRAVRDESAVCLLALASVDDAARAVVEGLGLGRYEYLRYKTPKDDDPSTVETVDLPGVSQDQIDDVLISVETTNLARDWINTPARDKAPVDIAASMAGVAYDAGVDVEIWDEARIKEEKLGALLGVAAGSDRPPALVVMSYRPNDPHTHLGLVGKGITFDSGGLSLKSASFMEEMKDDMSGAAVVAAATVAIARRGIPIRVTTVIPLTDNAVGGDATRPGDILTPVEGPTIEVLNTDAEGRLILADGLGVVRRHEPDLIIDVATLTGAAKVALGDQVGAVFGSSREVAAKVLDAAGRAGEFFWEMPLFQNYRKSLDSNLADIKNITGSRYGGAIAAALFLNEFSGDGDWAHLDIAGPARWRETAGEHVKGGSGVGVRTILQLAEDLLETD